MRYYEISVHRSKGIGSLAARLLLPWRGAVHPTTDAGCPPLYSQLKLTYILLSISQMNSKFKLFFYRKGVLEKDIDLLFLY